MAQQYDFTEGNIAKQIIVFSFPIIALATGEKRNCLRIEHRLLVLRQMGAAAFPFAHLKAAEKTVWVCKRILKGADWKAAAFGQPPFSLLAKTDSGDTLFEPIPILSS